MLIILSIHLLLLLRKYKVVHVVGTIQLLNHLRFNLDTITPVRRLLLL